MKDMEIKYEEFCLFYYNHCLFGKKISMKLKIIISILSSQFLYLRNNISYCYFWKQKLYNYNSENNYAKF